MFEKVTWGDILEDFKHEVPELAYKIADFRPHSHLKIQIWLNDGRSLIYDYLNKHCRFIFGNWRT